MVRTLAVGPVARNRNGVIGHLSESRTVEVLKSYVGEVARDQRIGAGEVDQLQTLELVGEEEHAVCGGVGEGEELGFVDSGRRGVGEG